MLYGRFIMLSSKSLLSDRIAVEIKKMILSEELAPGSKIPSEQEIATLYNVSIRSVREAIRSLVSTNVLEIHRGIGTFVSSIPGLANDPFGFEFMDSEALYPDLIEMRLILEPEIFILASKRATKEDLKEAEGILRKSECIVKKINNEKLEVTTEIMDKLWEYDMQFHEVVYKASQNKVADRVLPLIMKSIWEIYRLESYRTYQQEKNFSSMHKDIYNAIIIKDYELIKSLTKTHILKGTMERQKNKKQF